MATIRDIAKLAGVAPSTVSRVLTGHSYSSKKTRSKVVTAMRELKYQSPRTIIAIVIPDHFTVGSYIGNSLRSLFQELNRRNQLFEIITESSLDILKQQFISGAIALPYDNGLAKIWARKTGIPLVAMNTMGRHLDEIYRVYSDNFQGISLAMDHLKQYGHRKILCVPDRVQSDTNVENIDFEERCQAYFRWASKNPSGFPVPEPVLLKDVPEQIRKTGATALLVTGEFEIFLVYDILIRAGIRVPEDISVIGFENPGISEYLHPLPTTISQNFDLLAKNAIELLEQCSSSPQSAPRDIAVPFRLIPRESVRKIHGADSNENPKKTD